MIRLTEIKKEYSILKGKLTVLDIEELNFESGSQTALVGPSGSGKTTILKLIAGVIKPSQGDIIVDGKKINHLTEAKRDRYRRERIGYVAQRFNLMSNLTALENVMLAIYLTERISKTKQQEEAKKLLNLMGLEEREDHLPKELSNGEVQRVAIARALASQSDIILADEPTGNLDYKTGKEVMNLLKEICKQNKVTLITVTHDQQLANSFNQSVDLLDINQVLVKEMV